jgi:hypothetical protein
MKPKQHAAEIVITVLLFGPLIYYCLNKMQRQLKDLKVHYHPSRTQVCPRCWTVSWKGDPPGVIEGCSFVFMVSDFLGLWTSHDIGASSTIQAGP